MPRIKYSDNGEKLIQVPSELMEFHLEEGLKCIGKGVFENTVIKNINFPSTLELIEDDAFKNARIKEIIITNPVRVSDFSFYNTAFLENVVLNTECVPMHCFSSCGRSIESDEIKPAATDIKLINTKVIATYAFQAASINRLEIPDTLIEIRSGAFSYTTFHNMHDLVLPNGFKRLEAFDCTGIYDIYLPDSTEYADIEGIIEHNQEIKFHMSESLYNRFKILNNRIKDYVDFNFIVVESLDTILNNMSFRELNSKMLERENTTKIK